MQSSKISIALKQVYGKNEKVPLLLQVFNFMQSQETRALVSFIDFHTICENVDAYVRWLSRVHCIKVQLRKLECVQLIFEGMPRDREDLLIHDGLFATLQCREKVPLERIRKFQNKIMRTRQGLVHVYEVVDECEKILPIETDKISQGPNLRELKIKLQRHLDFLQELEGRKPSKSEKFLHAVTWFENLTNDLVGMFNRCLRSFEPQGREESIIAKLQLATGGETLAPGRREDAPEADYFQSFDASHYTFVRSS